MVVIVYEEESSTSSAFLAPIPPSPEKVTYNFRNAPPLILGSGSQARREILEKLGLEFIVRTADIDEKALGDRSVGADPRLLVRTLAVAKAHAILKSLPSLPTPADPRSLLLTADQVVVSPEGQVYEKPQDVEEARSFIRGHSQSSVSIVNGCALTAIESRRQVVATEVSEVHFRSIPEEGVDTILTNPDVLRCAGSIMVEDPNVAPYIDKVCGPQEAVMGLSPALLSHMMNELLSGNDDSTAVITDKLIDIQWGLSSQEKR